MNHVLKMEEVLKSANIKASQWKGIRVYLNGFGKDVKAYFEFDNPFAESPDNVFDETALKVFSNCNQSKSWKINRSKQVKHTIMVKLEQAGLVDGVCETWQEVCF